MTKKEKELIAKSVKYDGSPVDGLYIISKHRLYRGFWGKNGYNAMIILAYSYATDKIYHFDLDYEKDVIWCFAKIDFSIDVPANKDCVRLCFRESRVLDTDQLSAFTIY